MQTPSSSGPSGDAVIALHQTQSPLPDKRFLYRMCQAAGWAGLMLLPLASSSLVMGSQLLQVSEESPSTPDTNVHTDRVHRTTNTIHQNVLETPDSNWVLARPTIKCRGKVAGTGDYCIILCNCGSPRAGMGWGVLRRTEV